MKSIADVIAGNEGPSPKRERHNAFFEAVLKGRFHREYSKDAVAALGPNATGRVNKEAAWWAGTLEDNSIAPPVGVTPELVIRFFQFYERKHPTWDLPETREKLVDHYGAFEVEEARLSRSRNGSMVAATSDDLGLELDRFDRADYAPVTGEAVDELIARLKGRVE